VRLGFQRMRLDPFEEASLLTKIDVSSASASECLADPPCTNRLKQTRRRRRRRRRLSDDDDGVDAVHAVVFGVWWLILILGIRGGGEDELGGMWRWRENVLQARSQPLKFNNSGHEGCNRDILGMIF